jgi:hypothetical protein
LRATDRERGHDHDAATGQHPLQDRTQLRLERHRRVQAIAVGGLANHPIAFGQRRRRHHEGVVGTPEVAAEHHGPSGVSCDDRRRAQDVSLRLELHAQAGRRLELAAEIDGLQRVQRCDRVGFGVQRAGRAVARAALAFGEGGLFLLQAAGVRQHDPAQGPGRRGAPDPAAEAVAHQPRKVTAMVEVAVGQHDRVQAGRRHRERRPVAQAQGLVALEQAAIDQHPCASCVEEVARAGHGRVGAEEGQFEARVHLHLVSAAQCSG